jgi:homoserine O-acetyltransferase/O-succinyltransferase
MRSPARRRASAWSRSPADWLFPTSESRAIVHALNAAGARVSFAEIVTDKGHDAFLLEEPELFAIVRGFLDGAAKARGLTGGA